MLLGGAPSTGQGNLLNPQITAFFDMGGSLSSDGDNKARNRFNLRETELDLRGAVSPLADGVRSRGSGAWCVLRKRMDRAAWPEGERKSLAEQRVHKLESALKLLVDSIDALTRHLRSVPSSQEDYDYVGIKPPGREPFRVMKLDLDRVNSLLQD